jgi:iron complex outermembrane receptor protein
MITLFERLTLSAAFIFFLFANIWGNDPGISKLSGKVLNAENSEPVVNAVLKILDTDTYFTTNLDGSFKIENVSEVKIRVKVTHLAFQEKLLDVDFSIQQNQNLIVYLVPRTVNLSPVIVTDYNSVSKFEELNEYTNVLKGKELQRDLSLSLASTLKNATGLAVRSMGPAPSRPVIRGLGQDRVLISEDGNKTTDLSSTSPDHAVTLEPFTVNRIEVLRGPKVLTQTSTTIGGVVNVVRDEIPREIHNQIHLTLGSYGETVNNGFLAAMLTEIPYKPFSLRLELSRRKADDLKTPIGKLKNSNSQNFNSSAGLSFIEDFGHVGASVRFFNLDYGIPGGFIGAHPKGVDIEMYRRQINLESKVNLSSASLKSLNFNVSNVYYRHKEFEASGRIGAEFRIINTLGNINLNHDKLSFFDSGILGLSFEYRDFDIGGFVFTPPTKSLNISAYVFENYTNGKFSFEISARYNFDDIKPEYEKLFSSIGAVKRKTFNTYSLSLSGMYQLTEKVYLGANISKSSRTPTIEELFSEGPHLAAYSYEVGNPNLKAESGIGTEVFVYHKFQDLFFNVNVFYNDLNSYIIPRNSGEINFQTFLPIYRTSGVGAKLYGIDGEVEWEISDKITLRSSLSYTHGKFKESSSPLPQIPPLKGLVEIKYSTENFVCGINSEAAASQKRVDLYELPTDGYIVFNSYFQFAISWNDMINNFSVSVDNIFNVEYRNHLSRVKSILPEAGRNLRVVWKLMI